MSSRFSRIYFLFLLVPRFASAQTAPPNADTVELSPFVVSSELDRAREQILPDLGATAYTIDASQILTMPGGENAPFNQLLLRAPGVAQDSAVNGDLHVRGEHANLQYRIDGVLLPEGISGFGLELDPRFVASLQLIAGSLPAQYGFRTAGVVDLTTKSGASTAGGDWDFYGGSYSTERASFEDGGASAAGSYFADGSVEHGDLGIENPTSGAQPIHDATSQEKAFLYLSRIIDRQSRLSVLAGYANSAYQVPDTPGLPAGTAPDGEAWLPGPFNSAGLNERQNEENGYAIVSYQRTTEDLNWQAAAFGRYSRVHFLPDPTGDLFYNGVASDVDRAISSGGFQADGSDAVSGTHTVRGGAMLVEEGLRSNDTTTVFPVDDSGDPTGPAFPIAQEGTQHALFAGAYLQDEWKMTPALTLNGGVRADAYSASFDHEGQVSPRLNLIWQPASGLSLHAGYARYFTPPPLENVPAESVAAFSGTSNASAVTEDDPVKAERADYFDAGISWGPLPGLQFGIDGYDKSATDQLDDGLFGQSLVLSAFNYRLGRVRGIELTSSYVAGPFSAYANLALSKAQGEDWVSSQFLFAPEDLAYVRSHWIALDHDQGTTASVGASYAWRRRGRNQTLVFADFLAGSGLRQDGGGTEPNDPEALIPNGDSVPGYWSLNLGGSQTWAWGRSEALTLRVDVINVTDNVYELRSGSGVGVNAPQFGMRRGWFGSMSLAF
ncbi:MAG TPA: TonB-dependent receptor [Opitutaceae bacterium]|jgi:outer membrane receptor protein involved in Fe transport